MRQTYATLTDARAPRTRTHCSGGKLARTTKGCDCCIRENRVLSPWSWNYKSCSFVSLAMKICGVEEADVSEAYAAYAYLAYVETTLEDFGPTSPPPSPPLHQPQNLPLPLPPSISSSDSGRLQLQHRPHKTPSISRRPLHHRLHGVPSWEEECPTIRVDFLTHLPPEISVCILSFLRPKHLCRYVLDLKSAFPEIMHLARTKLSLLPFSPCTIHCHWLLTHTDCEILGVCIWWYIKYLFTHQYLSSLSH